MEANRDGESSCASPEEGAASWGPDPGEEESPRHGRSLPSRTGSAATVKKSSIRRLPTPGRPA